MGVRDSRYYKRQVEWMRKQTAEKHKGEDDTSRKPTPIRKSARNKKRKQNPKSWSFSREMKTMIDKGDDYNYLDRIRVFRPLKPAGQRPGVDVVLHIPIRLNSTGSGRNNRQSDIECLKKNLQTFEHNKGFKGDLVISVNGFIDNDFLSYVHYLESINNTQMGPFTITVFQRPNFGYQWGGFYEIWQKYKDSDIIYFATLECDCYLEPNWYLTCTGKIKGHGFVGMPPKIDLGGRTEMYFHTRRIWRSAADETIGDSARWSKGGTDYRTVMTHTRGGFYFCRRALLKKLDEVYGCFTESMGCDPSIDGVAMGEIGFASKTGQVGQSFEGIAGVVVDVDDGM